MPLNGVMNFICQGQAVDHSVRLCGHQLSLPHILIFTILSQCKNHSELGHHTKPGQQQT